jgi:APA family basic amino acid/polyamine antiporter
MAKDKLFFDAASKLNKHAVPSVGLKVQAVWASVLCLTGTYSELLDYVVFAVLIFYVLTIAGIFVLRRKWPTADRGYKTIGYPVIPVLYIAAAMLVMIVLLIYKPNYTWPGLGIVLFGLPVYYVWKKFKPMKS